MRISAAIAAAIGSCALAVLATTGCSSDSKSNPSSSSSTPATASAATSTVTTMPSPPAAQPADYTALLIKAPDLVAPEPFTAGPPTQNPDGKPGVATTFSTAGGTYVVRDTILVLPDPAAASAELDAAKAAFGSAPTPIAIGTGGVSASADKPDGAKSVTTVLFTEGKALITLEFEGPAGASPPALFITTVGQKQAEAIKTGLLG